MKTAIVLKGGRKVITHKETARLLIEMGRAVTVEEHLAAKKAAMIQENADMEKTLKEAEARQTKVVEPAKRKTRRVAK